jgi:hypothetical protein
MQPVSLDPDDPTVARLVQTKMHQRTALILAILIVVLGATAVGGFLIVSRPGATTPLFSTPGWLKVFAPILYLVGAGLVLWAWIHAIRSGRLRRLNRSPLILLSFRQQRALRSQVRRNVVEPGTDPAALRLMATSMIDATWNLWTLGALVLFAAGQVLLSPDPVLVGAGSFVTLCWLTGLVLASSTVGRARAFLRDHPTVHTGVSTADG